MQWLERKCESILIFPFTVSPKSYFATRFVRGMLSNQCSTSAPTKLKIRDNGGMSRFRI
jgi:hypothetical protein